MTTPRRPLASLTLPTLLALALANCTLEASAHAAQHAKVEGGLDKPAVRAVVAAHIDEIRTCYNTELLEDPNTGGRIVVDFTIATTGATHGVTITESTMPASFDACVAAAVETWQFPSAAQATAVSYPFQLSPG